MLNKKISIIICFSYTGDKKYVFDSKYLCSDLRRIISFSHNQVGCKLKNTYVITDLKPIKSLQDEIINDFCGEVINYLRELGLYHRSYNTVCKNPLDWLWHICTKINFGEDANCLYDKITRTILPVIRNSNIVEFSSLFTNFISITGKDHFNVILEELFRLPMANLFFYYTGHGIRLWSHDRTYKICLVIPGETLSEFYPQEDLQKRFISVLERVPSFIIFDCCHAETILEFPFKMTFSDENISLYISNNSQPYHQHKSICISSTRNNQTCGFYSSDSDQNGGSLFTYHLIRFLDDTGNRLIRSLNRDLNSNFLNLSRLREVEHNIQEYRRLADKKPQNIHIGLSNENVTQFPLWLFSDYTIPRFQLIEEDD